jgi:hypothetical protein
MFLSFEEAHFFIRGGGVWASSFVKPLRNGGQATGKWEHR